MSSVEYKWLIDLAFWISLACTAVGWPALFLFPKKKEVNWWLCGTILPCIIAAFYTLLCLWFWTESSQSFIERFQTKEGMLAMFNQSPGLLLAGYVHYLCFDLFIGAWEARRATAQGWPYWLLFICLFVTLTFGPTGVLLFAIVSLARGQWQPDAPSAQA